MSSPTIVGRGFSITLQRVIMGGGVIIRGRMGIGVIVCLGLGVDKVAGTGVAIFAGTLRISSFAVLSAATSSSRLLTFRTCQPPAIAASHRAFCGSGSTGSLIGH